MKNILVRLAAVLLIALSAQAFSQANSVIRGVVHDQSPANSARIPGVTVTATNERTAATVSTLTDGQGAYQFTDLALGVYKVTAALAGFQTGNYDGVAVAAGAEVQLDFTLQIAPPTRFTYQVVPSPFPYQIPSLKLYIDITSDRTTRQGTVIHYRGNVEMTTDGVVVHADELDWDEVTRQADVRGNLTVRVAPPIASVPPMSPFSYQILSRNGYVDTTSDRTTRQGTVIHYRGNVEMTTDGVIVHADELDWDEVTRQADVRGNVTVQILSPPAIFQRLATN